MSCSLCPAIRILTGLYWVMGPASKSCPSAMIIVIGVLFSWWSVRVLVESALLMQLLWLPLSSNLLVALQFFHSPSMISMSIKCRSAYSGSAWISESLVAAKEGPVVTLGHRHFPIVVCVLSLSQLPWSLFSSSGNHCLCIYILCMRSTILIWNTCHISLTVSVNADCPIPSTLVSVEVG